MPAPQEAQVAEPGEERRAINDSWRRDLGIVAASLARTFSDSSSGMIGGILISTMLAGSCKPPVLEFRRP